MRISRKILSMQFKGKNPKEAYQKAAMWIAKNIVQNKHVNDERVNYQIIREKQNPTPTFNLVVSVEVDAKELAKSRCASCKEFQKSFFIKDDVDCNKCKYKGFEKDVNKKLNIASSYLEEQLNKE